MLTITVKVDALPEQAQGVKEHLAMYLEQFGDTEVVEVKAFAPWQTSLFGRVKGGEVSGNTGRRNGTRSAHAGVGRL